MKNIFIAIGMVTSIVCGCTVSRSPINTPEIKWKDGVGVYGYVLRRLKE